MQSTRDSCPFYLESRLLQIALFEDNIRGNKRKRSWLCKDDFRYQFLILAGYNRP